jgi:two-component system CheB/CheR fusion protein
MLRKKFIIAIGASAGGQEAMSQFFDNTYLNGVSYVIVTHLTPFYKSLLADILQKRSRIQVCIAEHGMIIQPNVAYVMPENRMMTIADGKLQLEDRDLSVVLNNAINVFFTSLAKDTMFDKIAIILSGMGVDGTNGVKALKQIGAYVIAQTSSSSGESSMPDSIVADGLADEILEPKYMPDAIIKWLDNKILNGSN